MMLMTNNFYATILGYDEVRWFTNLRQNSGLPQQRLLMRTSEEKLQRPSSLYAIVAFYLSIYYFLTFI